MLQLSNVTFDAADPQRLAAFWAAATGRTIARSEPDFAMLTSDTEPVRMLFLKVPEGRTAKNRMHVDFRAADREAEVARLVGLGATRGETHHERGVNWTVLQDPEGNEFCVSQAR
jgi:predicted enzyme related to lactoylglutathione lyase